MARKSRDLDSTQRIPQETEVLTEGGHEVYVGKIVNYILPMGKGAKGSGEIRPAIVVAIWSSECVNLSVFTDFKNDYTDDLEASKGLYWATSSMYSKGFEGGTWHFQGDVKTVVGDDIDTSLIGDETYEKLLNHIIEHDFEFVEENEEITTNDDLTN